MPEPRLNASIPITMILRHQQRLSVWWVVAIDWFIGSESLRCRSPSISYECDQAMFTYTYGRASGTDLWSY